MREYIDFWKHYLDFSGVSSRKAFWVPILINGVFELAALTSLLLLTRNGAEPLTVAVLAVTGLYVAAAVMPSFAVQIRRLHDINRSGLWLLLTLVPFAGDFILLVFSLLPSVVEGNRYRSQ